jgi:deoxyribodipyrimidine photo-lyase
MPAKSSPVIVWFRRDLRLADNRALAAAAETGRALVACYVLDEAVSDEHALGGAGRWWLHHSLAALARQLEARGARLILRRGAVRSVIADLVAETGARDVHAGAYPERAASDLERSLQATFAEQGVTLHTHPGALLFHREAVRTKGGKPFKVFTPFWKACLQLPDPGTPVEAPRRLSPFAGELESDSLESWGLLPRSPDWATGFVDFWQPGETGAHARLESFLEKGLVTYPEWRDRPDFDGTSGLSPHLHFGELSPRQVWHVVRSVMAARPSARTGGDAYLRQLGWREFSYHLLNHWPTLPRDPFRPEFGNFPWRPDTDLLERWQRGLTGYPLVDAGMRQLWRTGRMHNRVRMVAASFLVKHLLIPWQDGAAWFWDTLVDADLANNSASWQWVAGCGADAAPYFRIFNPIIQGRKFDPDGSYIRRWVPELENLPASHIHEPWNAPAETLERAGVRLDQNYPRPVVDHRAARARALAAYDLIKK